jgi:hypothetical protein
MGGYRWAQCAALILLVLSGFEASAATRKYVTLPSAKSVASGNGATSRNGDLLGKQGAALEGEYIPGDSLNKSVPVPIIPRIDFSIPTTINAAKNLLKGGVQGMVLSAALQEMLDSVGAFIDENGQVVIDGTSTVNPASGTGDFYWLNGYELTHYSDAMASCDGFLKFNQSKFTDGSTITKSGTSAWRDTTHYSCVGDLHRTNGTTALGFTATTVSRLGVSCPTGSTYDSSTGGCLSPSGSVPLTDTQWDAMGQFADGQPADWLAGLLKDVCSAGNNPDSCFEAMKASSALSGPASVPGGSTTTTGTYTRPDGTTGTQTATTTTHYKITYGNNYFDFSKSVNTTTAQDGKTTSESQTDENPDPTQEEKPEDSFTDPDMPDVPSFYEPQYPDGLQGVWQAKKTALDDSAFLQFLRSFVPSFSGTCPSWGLSFDLGFISFGNHGFGSQCYALDFVGIVFLVTAAFAARALIFGG